jgi:prepilin-type N-terminal cleavage/methylation domain-containing protein
MEHPRPNSRARGFTLAELIIVLTAICIAAAVAVPKLLSARLAANETSAAATLRVIGDAEAQFKAARRVDLDGDHVGEYGFLKELSAATGVRTRADGSSVGGCVAPAPLASTFRAIDAHGELMRSGYLFRVFLPGVAGVGVGETEIFPLHGSVDSGLAAATWCAYAWPVRYATSGDRTFFAEPGCDVLGVDSPTYDGVGRFEGDACGSAFRRGAGAFGSIVAEPAVGTRGRDGNVWTRGW